MSWACPVLFRSGGEGVSQSPLKDKAFSTFLDQNPPLELRPEIGVSPPIFHRGSSRYWPNPSISVGGGQPSWLAFALRRWRSHVRIVSGAPSNFGAVIASLSLASRWLSPLHGIDTREANAAASRPAGGDDLKAHHRLRCRLVPTGENPPSLAGRHCHYDDLSVRRHGHQSRQSRGGRQNGWRTSWLTTPGSMQRSRSVRSSHFASSRRPTRGGGATRAASRRSSPGSGSSSGAVPPPVQ